MANDVFQAVARAANHPFHLAVSACSLASCIQRSCLGRQLTALALLIMSHGTTPTHPISPVYFGSKVRKDKQFHPKRKDPVLFPASLSASLLHVTIHFKPTLISKLPQNFLPGQAGVSPLESSSQSLGPHNNQKLPARRNHLSSSQLHPTFLSAFLAPTAQ